MNAMHAGQQAADATDAGKNDKFGNPKCRECAPGEGDSAPKSPPRGSGSGGHGLAREPGRRRPDGRSPTGREGRALPEASTARAVSAPPGAARKPAQPAAPMTPRNALGRYGEDLAVRRLLEAGMRILDRNWRCRDGEIDIVAADGDALVVCEVKTRRASWYEHPMAAVRPEKTARLRLLAERWMERHGGPPPGGVRIDVIGVLLPARGAPVVEHVRGVA